jgi:hypothetical protein
METSATPPIIENCPSTPEETPTPNTANEAAGNEESTSTTGIEEARLIQLKRLKGICVICYSSISTGKRCFPENCLHIFHFDCLQRWSEQKNQCPLCKKGNEQIISSLF